MLVRLSSWVLVLCLSGCAGLKVVPINPGGIPDSKAHGFRYYQASPFLLVATDNKGGLTSQILYLPDTTKKMSVQPFSYFATNESTLKFDNGVLTQAAATVDETVVPKAILDAMKDVLTAAAKAAAFNVADDVQTPAPAPSLFKIVVRGGEVVLLGGQGDPPVINTAVRIAP